MLNEIYGEEVEPIKIWSSVVSLDLFVPKCTSLEHKFWVEGASTKETCLAKNGHFSGAGNNMVDVDFKFEFYLV